jgi:Outer membrane lipoprotein carrier protein LolA-like
MKRLRRAAGFALLAMLMALPVRAAPPDPLSLDQLMTMLRGVPHVEARYIERRTMHALRAPIETRGTLRFDPPDRLEKLTDPNARGVSDRLTIKGNQLTMDRGAGAAPVILKLNEHPEIGVLVDSIRATLSGDGAALRRTFDITLTGNAAHWQFVLQPRDAEARKILQWMRVTGYAERITEIDTQDGDGDQSELMIVERAP